MTTPTPLEALADRLRRAVGARLRRDEPLGAMTTYRVGGVARLFVDVDDETVLGQVAAAVAAVPDSADLALLVVGKGSNLLVHDDGFPGLAIRLGDGFATMEIDGREVRAGGGLALPVLARQTASAGLTGLEWAVGVPGSVGGGVRMNAGGHGSDMAATLERVRRLSLRTGEDEVVAATDLHLGYRRSNVGPDEVVVRADFRLADGDAADGDGRDRRDRALASRAPARRPQRRVGVHQPRRRLGRPAHRSLWGQGTSAGHRGRVDQARQLHPGRPRWSGR